MSSETHRLPANKLTLGQADLLIGTIYHSCHHTFKWMLDYRLPATEAGKCAACCDNFSCPVCKHAYDGLETRSCPNCDCYLHESLLKGRREALESLGIKVANVTAPLLAKYRLEEQRKENRRRKAELQESKNRIDEALSSLHAEGEDTSSED